MIGMLPYYRDQYAFANSMSAAAGDIAGNCILVVAYNKTGKLLAASGNMHRIPDNRRCI